jgi:hypothetical protein
MRILPPYSSCYREHKVQAVHVLDAYVNLQKQELISF